MELLKKLYEIYSPSRGEKKLKRYIRQYVGKNIPDCTIDYDDAGNIYITKGKALEYPCIVAHLDQVQRIHSKDFKALETADIIIGYSANNHTQEGLGADDKNGIWVALKSLARYDNLKVAFFVQEEVGCVGSSQANMAFFDDCRFVIEPDRRGSSDFITSIGWSSLCSEEFINDIGIQSFGYHEEVGMMTDVQTLKEQGLMVSCCNISCGYYEPHSDHEFTAKEDLQNCLNLVYHIIESCTKVYPHKSEDLYHGYNVFHSHEYDDTEEHYEMEEIVSELYSLDRQITAEHIYDEYQRMYKSVTLEDISCMIESLKQTYLDY